MGFNPRGGAWGVGTPVSSPTNTNCEVKHAVNQWQ